MGVPWCALSGTKGLPGRRPPRGSFGHLCCQHHPHFNGLRHVGDRERGTFQQIDRSLCHGFHAISEGKAEQADRILARGKIQGEHPVRPGRSESCRVATRWTADHGCSHRNKTARTPRPQSSLAHGYRAAIVHDDLAPERELQARFRDFHVPVHNFDAAKPSSRIQPLGRSGLRVLHTTSFDGRNR